MRAAKFAEQKALEKAEALASLVQEAEDVACFLARLTKTFYSDKFLKEHVSQRDLIQEQIRHMTRYINVLDQRIAFFSNK